MSFHPYLAQTPSFNPDQTNEEVGAPYKAPPIEMSNHISPVILVIGFFAFICVCTTVFHLMGWTKKKR